VPNKGPVSSEKDAWGAFSHPRQHCAADSASVAVFLFEARTLTAFRAKNMRVLIIEDDAETADYVSDGLRRSGHVADQVSDGREGLMMAAGGEYDVIVVDRMLP
jgi:PleD family two-component response regulator